ncbi:hypothetical protein BC826DRAFT_1102512 [Russula brevipes]|nr:hypothetical protein BC826DRAFT_1102512 [Russula brevipes]
MAIGLEHAQLVSLALSTFLYGIFFTLFMVTIVMTFYDVPPDVRRQRMTILPLSSAMLLVATVHITVVWMRAKYGFIDKKGGSVAAFYRDIVHPTSLIKVACLCLQAAIGDGVIVWRLYIVYDRRILVAIPAILLVTAYTVIACAVVVIMANSKPGGFISIARPYITAHLALSMLSNVVFSGAIAWRIFTTGGPLRMMKTLWPMLFILIESSALYALCETVAFITYLCGTNGQQPVLDALVPVIGIAFSLLVLQIRFHASAPSAPRNDERYDGKLSNARRRGEISHAIVAGDSPHDDPGAR